MNYISLALELLYDMFMIFVGPILLLILYFLCNTSIAICQ